MTDETTEPQAEVADDAAGPQAEAEEVEQQLDDGKEWTDLTVEEKVEALAQGLAVLRPAAKTITFPAAMQFVIQPVPVQEGGGAIVTLIDPQRNEHYRFRLMQPAAEQFASQLSVQKVDVFGPAALRAVEEQRNQRQAASARGRRR